LNPFTYQRATAPDAAIHAITAHGSKFLGGGTNLVDLMKDGVESPSTLIDINHIGLDQVTGGPEGVTIGASAQLRNMATTGGNLMQRTRCYYFMDTAFPACNKRIPGSGCGAVDGFNRIHAILGQTDDGSASSHTCIATNPSDMSVALYALNAKVEVRSPKGKRSIPVRDFHRLVGTTPSIDTNLKPDELIVAITLPDARFTKNFWYLKARDRQSYAFALVSVATGLEMDGNTIKSAGLSLGGVAHKPWHSPEAEYALIGKPATVETFEKAADLALKGAKGYANNTFKIELAKQCVVRALTTAAKGVQA
jgi:xanthine dehydrogenase YagS FAD-binding subunit